MTPAAAPLPFVTLPPCSACCLDAHANHGLGCQICDYQHEHGGHQYAAVAPASPPKEDPR
jgi:hypothetical protein